MDDIINTFIELNFIDEAKDDIYHAIGIFQAFNYIDPIPKLHDLLMLSGYDESANIVDKFRMVILEAQNYLLDRHGVVLSPDSTISFNNKVLSAFLMFMNLEDPIPVLRVIESADNDDFKLARILAMYTDTPETTFLQIIDQVRPVFMSLLASYLYAQEDNHQAINQTSYRITKAVKAFKEVFGIPAPVQLIIDSDVVMGEEFMTYVPLFEELREGIADEEVLLSTLLFLLIYSCDGVDDPIHTFKNYVDRLTSDLGLANRLTKTLLDMHNKLSQHKGQVQ